jgi:outer membrane biosynthesis protein TonB
MHISFKSSSCISKRLAIGTLLLLISCVGASAQSTNIEFPTPVIANDVSGVIEARDVGDARLTRHFYLLTGTQGDLILTVESSNLNGDIDLFTAGSLRPLTKLGMYAGLSTSSATKSVFLRARESLILRVEARSSNDEAGRYHIRFSGGFEPIANATPPPENVEPTVSSSNSRDKNVRRVNSAGARIKEEETEEVAKAEPPKPAPAPKVKEKKTKPVTTATAPPEEPAPVKPRTTRTARTARAKTPARTPSRRQPATTAKKREEPAATQPGDSPTTPATLAAEPALNPRLIIETRDGMRVERYMSQVRRVTVERGLLIVVTSDGKVERRPMTNVLRVMIEP